jgi:hypothetical protein
MKVLSYGGGIQTVVMGRMVLAGEMDRPDLVIFADTQRERAKTYEVIAREFALLNAAGIEAVTVTGGDLGSHGGKMLPLFTVHKETGERGRLRTICSSRFKTEVVARELRRRGFGPKNPVETWLGITTDEIIRVKPNVRVTWMHNRWPFIERDISRGACEAYLNNLGLERVKSACYFCPNASQRAALAALEPGDLARAIAFDESLRNVRPGYESFVHGSCRPLSEVVADDRLQISLLDYEQDECSGSCFT